ncbi:MAG: phosphohistidine phosphatase SixA [Acidiferrobacterales bacterium]|nr:phosphohistidine phosphatase SixA [Acidiferrobacterales bacterium]
MKLYLAQHGEAASKDVDPGRGLTSQGKKDMAAMAAYLKARGISIGQVFDSGKLRAHQTAEILASAIAPGATIATHESINPLDLPTVIAEEIEQWDEDTLVVGHLPFLAKLVTLLITNHEEPPIVNFTPGAVICLERTSNAEWHIVWLLPPVLVRD